MDVCTSRHAPASSPAIVPGVEIDRPRPKVSGALRVDALAVGSLVAALLLIAPGPALACPVCGLAGTDDSNSAYVAMTIMLSALPLGMIAGVAIWIRRRIGADGTESPEPGSTAQPETGRHLR